MITGVVHAVNRARERIHTPITTNRKPGMAAQPARLIVRA